MPEGLTAISTGVRWFKKEGDRAKSSLHIAYACINDFIFSIMPRKLGKSLLGSSGGQELGNELSAPYEVSHS